jgi:hypothetical protein
MLQRKRGPVKPFRRSLLERGSEGLWFFERIQAEGKERVHVYSTEFDNFLNNAAESVAIAES